MDYNLYSAFRASFPEDLGACAIEIEGGRYWSYDDIDRASAKFANLLVASGALPGSRVAVQVEKSVEALVLYLACVRAGLVYLPLNTAYREGELDYFLGNAEPDVVVCSPESFSWLSKIAFRHRALHVFTLDADGRGTLIERAAAKSDRFKTLASGEDELAAILYTSGTTGRSKGAKLTHGNLLSNARVLNEAWGWQRDDVLLHTLPLFHVHGLFVAAHGALLAGAKMIFRARFDAREVVQLLPSVTVFMGVPTYYVRLLADPGFGKACSSGMRLFVCGSAPLLSETFEAFRTRTGHTILERYGMSETVMLTSNPYRGERLAGTVGQPLSGVTVRVVDDDGKDCPIDHIGHIQVKGPNVFAGYWRMPEKTAEEFTADGFFKTGDMGKWITWEDASMPYLSIVGRSKDLIITGGYNVYPKEIEAVIDDLPGVAESAVIGIAHPDFGEAVTAVVVAREGVMIEEAILLAALKAKIANFKVPKRIHVVPELPRNAMGKVQKNVLRDTYSRVRQKQ
jgi:malonyl-CoA/methylmalonyl-CoA synthetase